MSKANESKRLIKFLVNQHEHDLIRIAGALRRTSMADFARLIVVREAQEVASTVKLPELEPDSRPSLNDPDRHSSKPLSDSDSAT